MAHKGEICVAVEIMKTDREEKSAKARKRTKEREREGAKKRKRGEETGRVEEVKHSEREREEVRRSEMRCEKVRKGSDVLFGSCMAEAPTGRCYDGNVLFGPSRPTLRPVPPPRESSGLRTERDGGGGREKKRVRDSEKESKRASSFLMTRASPFIPRGTV